MIDAGAAATIAAKLASTTAANPTYAQTGNYISEHMFRPTDTMSSGCVAAIGSYCTTRSTEANTGFERYLPYQLVNAEGKTGWQGKGTLLDYGEWWGKAEAGALFSPNDYLLFNK